MFLVRFLIKVSFRRGHEERQIIENFRQEMAVANAQELLSVRPSATSLPLLLILGTISASTTAALPSAFRSPGVSSTLRNPCVFALLSLHFG